MTKTALLLLIGALFFVSSTNAQSSRWKRTRYEITGGLGITSFQGELGGGDEAKHFFGDMDWSSVRPVMAAGVRYKVLERLAAKGTLYYGMVHGADENAKNIYRQDRNLSFRSQLVEFGVQAEYSIIKEPTSHRYSLRRGRRFNWKSLKINTYLFAGVSGFWFNPKGQDDGPGGSGDWVKLQPLGTEGQGLMEGRDHYSRVSMSFPFGIGFKYAINRRISVGLEFGARYTLTDYIDDVSTTYVDNAWLASVNPLAARMADKSIQTNDENDPLPGVIYGGGQQRGNTAYNDYYMFSIITVSYKLRTGRNGLPKF